MIALINLFQILVGNIYFGTSRIQKSDFIEEACRYVCMSVACSKPLKPFPLNLHKTCILGQHLGTTSDFENQPLFRLIKFLILYK